VDVPKVLAAGLSVSRIAFGTGYLLRPEQARTSWLGRVAKKPAAQVIVRAQGARDVALGAGAMRALVRGDARELRVWVAGEAASDLVDLLATAGARDHLPKRRARFAMVVAGTSALAGGTAAALLRPPADG
jgi:hypothetical protein